MSEEKPSPIKKAEKPLELTSWKWVNQPTLNHIRIEGVVKNNSKKTYERFEIYIIAEESKGDFLGAGSSYLRPTLLPPGGASTFTVHIDDAICPTKNLSISYRFE